jgi:phosphoglycolate phosphatase-like HAD superfamily hydrolase
VIRLVLFDIDIRCARSIGAKALAVATGGASLEELKRHNPDWAVADLRGANLASVLGSG